ncbi:pyruvate dehydrogenase [Rhodococcus antarcticus]|uniref:Pyruvate dehydrogenase n=1 Tax=Rhodococcus antarcticus TaxID=2987751 RepID=A0ABY6P477_9NOCA|nr:pyruvate dehydrogenase [Rhodococcus antarcticus]UZJ26066.1 pyruvate dehydrogenase [Rhodococcus antarcticus]
MAVTIAEQLVSVLVQAGVQRVYGLVGDSLNPVADAVRRSGGSGRGGIDWVHVHNEESAALAAAAEALLTGRLAVCAASCGPGTIHLLQGLYDAHRTGAPVLAIATHIPQAQIGSGYFQETHPEALFAECSHYCELVSSPSQMPRIQRIAQQHALGLGGVAVLVLPGDVAAMTAAHPTGSSDVVAGRGRTVPLPGQVVELARLIEEAASVTLFCGAGVRDAREEVLALAELVGAPVGHALGGKEWIQWDNPFDVGMSGLLGYGASYQACHEAELLVLLGTDFPYGDFLPQARTVQVDRDPSRLGRRTVLELGVVGDVGETLRAVLPLISRKPDRSFLHGMLRRHAKALEHVVSAYTQHVSARRPIHPEHVAAELDDLLGEDAVVTVDTGMCNVWAARYITPSARRRVIGSWKHGTMANALPHAIGAQSAFPGRQVVAMSGDGGLEMLLGELLTVVQNGLPITVVVFNNGSLGMVRLEMMVAGYPSFETDHGPVDHAAIARACGFHAVRVDHPDDVRAALREALAHDGPSLVDVVTDPDALSLPPMVTGEQVKGFALAAGRTVLQGGVGKMLDVARANLRNIPRPSQLGR